MSIKNTDGIVVARTRTSVRIIHGEEFGSSEASRGSTTSKALLLGVIIIQRRRQKEEVKIEARGFSFVFPHPIRPTVYQSAPGADHTTGTTLTLDHRFGGCPSCTAYIYALC